MSVKTFTKSFGVTFGKHTPLKKGTKARAFHKLKDK